MKLKTILIVLTPFLLFISSLATAFIDTAGDIEFRAKDDIPLLYTTMENIDNLQALKVLTLTSLEPAHMLNNYKCIKLKAPYHGSNKNI